MSKTERSFEDFDDLFRRFSKRVYNHAEHRLGDKGLAEDVVQETFLDLFLYLDHIDHRSSPRPLIFTIGVHAENRILKKLPSLSETSPGKNPPLRLDTHITPEDRYLAREELLQVIRGLKPGDVEVLIERGVYGASYQAIAKKFNITVHAANKRLARARLAAKKRFRALSRWAENQ